jgi:hypothetical protein
VSRPTGGAPRTGRSFQPFSVIAGRRLLGVEAARSCRAAYKGGVRRYATVLGLGAVTIGAASLVAGSAGGRSILYEGIAPLGGPRIVISDAGAVRDVNGIRRRWLAEIASRGRRFPQRRFPNLSARAVRARVQASAARARFSVERMRFLHPRQVALVVVVQTRHYLAAAHAFGPLLVSLEQPYGRRGRRTLAFEGWFLEAQDERGIPFAVLSGVARGPHAGGGQWARSEELYPAPHG